MITWVSKEEFWFINSWQDHTELQAVLTIFFLAKVGEPTFYRHTGLQTTLWIIDGTRFADWARRTFSAQWNLSQAVGLGCTVKNRGKKRKLRSLCFPLCLGDIFLNSTEILVRHLVRWSCRWIQFSYMAGAKQRIRVRNALSGEYIKSDFKDNQKPSSSPYF